MPVETHGDLAVLINHPTGAAGMRHFVRSSDRLYVLDDVSAGSEATCFHKLAVLVTASQLGEVAEIVSGANRANRLRALLIESDVDSEWIPYMIERANLRILRNVLIHHGPEVPTRFLWAWANGIEDQVIASATAFDGRLVVRNCAMRTFEVGFDAYPALASIPSAQRTAFTIDADGLFLHWAGADVHLTLEDVLLATDAKLREKAVAKRLASDRAFGAAVRALREEHGLRQADIPGLSARHVRRIEHGFVPGEDALLRLAAAHGMDPDEYLETITDRME
jgi:hypothetical protein